MKRSGRLSRLLVPIFLSAILVQGQTSAPNAGDGPPSQAQTQPAPANQAQPAETPTTPEPAIPAHAPHMSRQTRLQLIRDFETQIVYARTVFPMGMKGIKLRDGHTSPNGPELQQSLALYGPSVKPGDPAHISFVQIKDNYIHFELNGGPLHRKKWYEHITISGANDNSVNLGQNETVQNPHGTCLDVYFNKYVPEMTEQQLRDLLYPALDFKARNEEEAYLNTLPANAKAAIQAHHVLVGMNTEMVTHAKGRPPKKVRERDGEIAYEEWIYGEPPQDVDFVRIVDDEVVRVETMKVGGEKIVRTEKEVILEKVDKDTEAKKEQQEEHPGTGPTLRRPGEDTSDVPKSSDGESPVPVMLPPDPRPDTPPTSQPQIPGQPGGPGEMAAGG